MLESKKKKKKSKPLLNPGPLQPSILNPRRWSINPAPYAAIPETYTLYPKPYTLTRPLWLGLLRIPARGNAAAPKGERQRGSSQHWKGIIVLVNSRLITLLDSTAATAVALGAIMPVGVWCRVSGVGCRVYSSGD